MEIIGLDKNVSQFNVSSLSSGKMSYSAQQIDNIIFIYWNAKYCEKKSEEN